MGSDKLPTMTNLAWTPWPKVVKIRPDLKSCELSLNIFAADLYDVAMGQSLMKIRLQRLDRITMDVGQEGEGRAQPRSSTSRSAAATRAIVGSSSRASGPLTRRRLSIARS